MSFCTLCWADVRPVELAVRVRVSPSTEPVIFRSVNVALPLVQLRVEVPERDAEPPERVRVIELPEKLRSL